MQKLNIFQFCTIYGGIFCMYDWDWQIQISYPNFSESKWRCSNVGKNIPKIQIVYLSSRLKRPHYSRKKNLIILYGTEITAILALSKFGCHGNALCSLENSNSIYLSSTTPKTLSYTQNCYHITYRTAIHAFFGFQSKFGCYGNENFLTFCT